MFSLMSFKCDDCGEKFSQKDNLQSHMRNQHLKTFDDVLACDNFLILPNNMLFVITTVPNNAFALLIKTIFKAKNVFGRVLYYFSLPLIN